LRLVKRSSRDWGKQENDKNDWAEQAFQGHGFLLIWKIWNTRRSMN